MGSTLVSIEDDPEYSPATLLKYSCGFLVKAIRSVDSVHFQPHPVQGESHICNQMLNNDPSVFSMMDMVKDSIAHYFTLHGKPQNIVLSFQNDLSTTPNYETMVLDRLNELGYTLHKKVKKECGECDEQTHIVVFRNNGVDQASTA